MPLKRIEGTMMKTVKVREKKKIKEKENQNNVYVWKKKCNLLNKMEPPKNTKEKNAADLWICVENVICLTA